MTDTTIRESLSANIRRLLAERGLSQTAVSKATGDPLMTINDLVNGRCTPNVGIVQRVADVLEVGVDALLETRRKNSRRTS